jgi:hypothetical protein
MLSHCHLASVGSDFAFTKWHHVCPLSQESVPRQVKTGDKLMTNNTLNSRSKVPIGRAVSGTPLPFVPLSVLQGFDQGLHM